MGVFDEGYEQAISDTARQPAARIPAGFMEGFTASYQTTRQEGLSISERQNLLDKEIIRNEAIQKATGRPLSITINTKDLLKPSGELSTTIEVARRARAKQILELSSRHPEIKTDPDIHREIIEDSRRIREKSDKVLSNTSFAGKIGSFTGVMAATMGDPLVLASIPFGASSGATILRTALTEAGINMVSEALIQPFVYRYKTQVLGSPYGVGEALTSVAAAGAGGAVLGGGVRALARGIDHLRARPRLEGIDDLLETFEKNVTEPTQLQKDAAHVLGDYADVLRETPFDTRPDLDDIHLKAVAKAISDLDIGQPVDVSDIIGDFAPTVFPKTIRGTAEQTPATVNQSLSQFIKNSGGVSIDKAGALRGEYDALFENGGRQSGAVKRVAGKSPDELAQAAHDAGFIDEPDPALLKEALQRDLSGEKVRSLQSDTFERRLDLEIDREFKAWAEMAEKEFEKVQDEIAVKARGILDLEDVPIAGEQGLRSAREVLMEMESDINAANILQKCLATGAA